MSQNTTRLLNGGSGALGGGKNQTPTNEVLHPLVMLRKMPLLVGRRYAVRLPTRWATSTRFRPRRLAR